MQPGAPGSFWARLGGCRGGFGRRAVSVGGRREQGPGSGWHPALGWSSRRPGPLGEQVGTHRAPVGRLVLDASEAERKHLRSPPALGSLAPRAPRPSPSRTLATENLRPFGTVAVWRRSPTQTNFHLGSPPQGRHEGSGWPRVHEGPSVAKRDWRRQHPARGLTPGNHVNSGARAQSPAGRAEMQPRCLRVPGCSQPGLCPLQGSQGAGVLWAGAGRRGAGCGRGPQTRGFLGGKCTYCPLFLFFALPSNWGSLVQMIPQDTALDSGGPVRSGWVQANHGKKPPPAFLPWASAARNIYIAISIYLRSGI